MYILIDVAYLICVHQSYEYPRVFPPITKVKNNSTWYIYE